MSGTTRLNRYQKKHSPTHTYHGHQSFLICFIHQLRSMASSLFNLTHLTIFFHNLCPSVLWSTSWPGTLDFILHTFLRPIIVFFLQHGPYHCNLFRCSTEIMPSNPSLSLNPLLGILSCSFTAHIHSHLCPLKCYLIFLSYGPGLTSMQHTTLHTTIVQPQLPSHFQWNILIGKQWYQLPEFIPSSLDCVLHSCIRISIHTQHVI